MGSETHAKDYEMQEVAVEETSSESPVVISTRRYASKKMESAPSLRADNGSYATSRRRRRSASSRKKSESRNLETASIPLHSESERRGKVVELEMASVSYEVVDETLSSDKADKKNKKKDKKAERKEKNAKREKNLQDRLLPTTQRRINLLQYIRFRFWLPRICLNKTILASVAFLQSPLIKKTISINTTSEKAPTATR